MYDIEEGWNKLYETYYKNCIHGNACKARPHCTGWYTVMCLSQVIEQHVVKCADIPTILSDCQYCMRVYCSWQSNLPLAPVVWRCYYANVPAGANHCLLWWSFATQVRDCIVLFQVFVVLAAMSVCILLSCHELVTMSVTQQ